MEHVSLDEISDDATFRIREDGDVGELAASIGRLGQLAPLELRPLPGSPGTRRYQLISGFRRLAALRLLQRERALARVHEGLADADAWALALAGPLFAEAWSPADLDALAGRVKEHLPWATPALEAMRARAARRGGGAPAAASAPGAPRPGASPAADPVAFARRLAVRAYELNQDMATAYEAWGSLPRDGRALVLDQVRYLARLLALLEREPR